MMTETAIVTRRDGRRVELELQRGTVCGDCELNQACGTGALGRLLGRRKRPIVIETSYDLNPGDRLKLGLSEAALVRASLVIYGLPILGMVVGGLLAVLAGVPEALIVLAAAIGLLVGFVTASYLAHRVEDGNLEPYIMDIQPNSEPPGRS